MSDALAEAVARVWPDGASAFEALGGGITNHNVKVTRPDGVFVLRIAGRETDVLGIDRHVERAATEAAAAAGVGPEVVAFVEPEGWLVTRFIEGAIPARSRSASPPSSTASARPCAPCTTARRSPVGSTRSASSRRIATPRLRAVRRSPPRSRTRTRPRGGSRRDGAA